MNEIFFRGEHYPAPHPPLVDVAAFDAAHAVLRERGEDISKRASNPSEYLLAGVVTCVHCGHRYVGGAAHGRGGRYRYYRCFTRQRYGAEHCSADSLRADALEDAVIESLSATYERSDLIDRAIADYRNGAASTRPQLSQQLAQSEAEIHKVEEAIDRYLRAFENGTLSEAHCGARMRGLAERLAKLRRRTADLTYELADEDTDSDAQPDIVGIKRDLAALLATDAPASTKKALVRPSSRRSG